MPQIVAYDKLKTLFGRMRKWNSMTDDVYFWSLDPHVATHHLHDLIEAFLSIRIPNCCSFGIRGEVDVRALPVAETKEPAAVLQPDLLRAPVSV